MSSEIYDEKNSLHRLKRMECTEEILEELMEHALLAINLPERIDSCAAKCRNVGSNPLMTIRVHFE